MSFDDTYTLHKSTETGVQNAHMYNSTQYAAVTRAVLVQIEIVQSC